MTKKLNIDIIARDKSQRALNQVQGNLAKTKSSVINLKNALIGIGAGAANKGEVNDDSIVLYIPVLEDVLRLKEGR